MRRDILFLRMAEIISDLVLPDYAARAWAEIKVDVAHEVGAIRAEEEA